MVTVLDLLKLSSLHGATIVVGGTGQERPVLSANVMAVPDIAMWAQRGDFLIATDYVFKDNLEQWDSVVEQLSAVGVAALAFKPGRFVREIPQAITRAADHYQLPLLWLPDHVVFSQVVFEIVEYILSDKSEIGNELLPMIKLVGNNGLADVLESIAQYFHRPLAICSTQGEPLINAAFPLIHNSVPQTGELAGKLDLDAAVKVIPLPLKGKRPTMLLAIGPLDDGNLRHQGDIYVIQNLMTVVMIQYQMVSVIEQKYRDMFFRDWFHKHHYANDELQSWSDRLGLFLPDHFRILSLSSTVSNMTLLEIWKKLVKHLTTVATKGTIMGNDILIIEQAEENRLPISDIIDYIGVAVVGGWSAAHNDWQNIRVAIREARTTRVIAMKKQHSGVLSYDKLGADIILHHLGINPQSASYYRTLLAPILQYDEENNTSLLLTLKIYLECRRVKDTAVKLYTHYNTILYRLARIQKLLNVDLDDPEVQFILHLGLRLMPYFKNTS